MRRIKFGEVKVLLVDSDRLLAIYRRCSVGEKGEDAGDRE